MSTFLYWKLTETLIKIRLDMSVLYMLWSLCIIIFKKHLQVFNMSHLEVFSMSTLF